MFRKWPIAWHQNFRIARRSDGRSIRSLWTEHVGDPERKVQCYRSKSDDPVLNLSIEQFLLQNCPRDSVILFLYCNRPSIIIGRNQNPWVEVNLQLLKAHSSRIAREDRPHGLPDVELVRRRSGGGTVFHDSGNVNWTVISPSESFTRDKHAEMIVRALRALGVDRSRVNERHDVVLDISDEVTGQADGLDTHRTQYTQAKGGSIKVSGSAYKLTRGRALHHGTCLLSSPNLRVIPQFLHSPGRPFYTAKGVESVSSPVGNIGISIETFHDAVLHEFAEMYGNGDTDCQFLEVDDKAADNDMIVKNMDEMRSPTWLWEQTPQFVLEYDVVKAKSSTDRLPPGYTVRLAFKHGQVEDADFGFKATVSGSSEGRNDFLQSLRNLKSSWMKEESWASVVDKLDLNAGSADKSELSVWLDHMLPTPKALGFPI